MRADGKIDPDSAKDVNRFVAPHPNPLPRGEGTRLPFGRIFQNLFCAAALSLAVSTAFAEDFAIPRVDNLQIDGQSDDWKSAGLHIDLLSRLGHVGTKNDPSGEAKVRLGWDDRGLILFIKVHDSQRLESGKNSLYRGDSVEIFLSPKVGSPDFLQVIASPGIEGSKDPGVRFNSIGYGKTKSLPPDVDVKGGNDKEGWWLEARLGWKSLGIEPKLDDSIGVQICINDRDVPYADIGDLNKKNNEIDHLCWLPDRSTVSDPTRMISVKLSKDAVGSVFTRNELDLASKQLSVQAPAELADQSLTIQQNGKTIGTQTLAPGASELNIAQAKVQVDGFDVSGAPLELSIGGKSVGQIRLYGALNAELTQSLQKALNSADEKERFALLKQIQNDSTDQQLRQDIQTLLPLVENWANGREMAEANQLAAPSDYLFATVNPNSPPALRKDSPIYPLYGLYRARNLIWRVIQGGYPEENNQYCALARQLLAEAKKAAPQNPIIRMYLNEPLPWPAPASDANAPEWANHQRHALHKLTEIVHWWIDQRQISSGSFGGGWNDDVEMWRNWLPVMVAFDDPKSAQAQEKLAEAIFAQPHMKRGYSNATDDVEHTSEDSADTITPMLYLKPDDAKWRDRALVIAELMRKVWTGTNAQGQLMFKNIVMNDTRTGTNPKHAYDVTLGTRAVQPALAYWTRTRDPQLTPQFTAWLDTWVAATAREENGKPAGILPSAIHFPDGKVAGLGGDWWKPDTYDKLYHWPWYVSDMLHVMLMAYQVTGDAKYLEPIKSMAAIRADYLKRNAGPTKLAASGIVGSLSWGGAVEIDPSLKPGSKDWCAAQMGPLISGPLMIYRQLTKDTQFDSLIRQDGDGYAQFILDGDAAKLTQSLSTAASAFAQNKEAFTSEVRWTDRVFRLTGGYLNRDQNPPYAIPDPRLIYSSTTGDPSTWQGCRMAAVRWHTPPTDIAALVKRASSSEFEADLYHFGEGDRTIDTELLQLAKGSYVANLTAKDSVLQKSEFSINTTTRVPIKLPSKTLCTLKIIAK